MKIIVTGACGFIGSQLSKKLINQNHQVIGIDDLSKGSLGNVGNLLSNKNFTFKKASILNKNSFFRLPGADAVVHLAAAKIPRYGDRLSTLVANTRGMENVLEYAKKNKSKVIFASTSDVYGKNPKTPFTENSEIVLGSTDVARWSYAISKIYDEHLCFGYAEKYGLEISILRLFGVYGPYQNKTWWGGPQALFISQISNDEKVEIHGDGKQTRSFVYIDDVVDAFTKAIENKKANGKIINIGSSEEINILDLAKLIAKTMNKKLIYKKIPYKSFTGKKYEDVRRRKPSIKRAESLLGWKPKVKLTEGLKRTVNWYIDE